MRFIALLRAINVGGHTVRMAELRRHFEALPLADVETFIASGNVAFHARARSARKLEARIERHLRGALGYDVATFLRTVDELAAIAALQPFTAPTSYIVFLREPPGRAAERAVLDLRNPIDDLALHGREVHWHCNTSLRDSQVSGARIETAVRGPATVRNFNTVRRLVERFGP